MRMAWLFILLFLIASTAMAVSDIDIDVGEDTVIQDFDDPGFDELEKMMEFPDDEDVESVDIGIGTNGMDDEIYNASPMWMELIPCDPKLVVTAEEAMEMAGECMKERRCRALEKLAGIQQDLGNEEVAMKIKELAGECMAMLVKPEPRPLPRIQEFRERLMEIRAVRDRDERIRLLKELRKEIDEELRRLLGERRKVRYDELEELAPRMRIRKGVVEIGNSSIKANASIEVNGTEIKPANGKVLIGGLVEAEEIEIEDGVIKAGGKPLRVLPDKLKRLGIRKARLRLENGKPVYEAEEEREGKLLLLIPVKIREAVIVDAETGEVERKRPWWALLAG